VLRLTSDGIANQNAAFIHKDGDKGLPIPVYDSAFIGPLLQLWTSHIQMGQDDELGLKRLAGLGMNIRRNSTLDDRVLLSPSLRGTN